MSESEFAAAMRPNVRGSSTIGVKKSTLKTSAMSELKRYTPASSADALPTSTFGSVMRGSPPRTCASTLASTLDAQPAQETMCVKRVMSLRVILTITSFRCLATFRVQSVAERALRIRTARKCGEWSDDGGTAAHTRSGHCRTRRHGGGRPSDAKPSRPVGRETVRQAQRAAPRRLPDQATGAVARLLRHGRARGGERQPLFSRRLDPGDADGRVRRPRAEDRTDLRR